MTKNELKALIEKKVQRQGTQGAIRLAPILNEIIDLIPDSTGGGGSDTTKYLTIDSSEFQDTNYYNKKEIELSPEQKELLSENLSKIVIDVHDKDANSHYYLPLFLFAPNVGAAWSLDTRSNESSTTRFGANYYRVEYFDGHMEVWEQVAEFAIVSKVEQDFIGYDFVPKMSAVYDAINK